jgi:SAM-dependent methyltransferase
MWSKRQAYQTDTVLAMAISAGNMVLSTEARPRKQYVPGLTVEDYVSLIEKRFPAFADKLWFGRNGAAEAIDDLSQCTNEFETDADTGRGTSYRRAQRNRMVRAQGIHTLFTLAAGVPSVAQIHRRWTALDVLGGDGLLAHVIKVMAPHTENAVITSDMAGHMIVEALRAGLPAIRQRAQFLFLRDETIDAVLLAYGTHHITPGDRPLACQEAARVLRPGGKLVLHDFEQGSPVALWFSEVVHRYSRAGHQYDHFSIAEMERYFEFAGLRSVTLRRIYDPLVISGGSPAEARSLIADYLLAMYGLDYLITPLMSRADIHQAVWELAQTYFVYADHELPDDSRARRVRKPTIYRHNSQWTAEVPRVALVAVGEK